MPATIEQSLYTPANRTMLQVLTDLGLSANLKLCLDAGDSNSIASGAGTSWLDTAGSGYDFFRGTTSGADATDPTFFGTPGKRSKNEFWSFDGGDYFVYDSANEAWMNNLHKDNALFTVMFLVYGFGSSLSNTLMGDNGGVNTNIGVYIRASTTNGTMQFACFNGSGVTALTVTSADIGFRAGQWNFCALTYDEAAAAGSFFCNGTAEAISGGYSSPSAAAASFTMELATRGNASVPYLAGGRMGAVAIIEGAALNTTQLGDVYQTMRSRYEI